MSTAPDALSITLQMLTALAIVVGGLLVAFYLMKRFLKRDAGGSSHALIRVVANQYIGVKKKYCAGGGPRNRSGGRDYK